MILKDFKSLVQCALTEVSYNNIHTLAGTGLCYTQTQPAGSAGDKRSFSLQVFHLNTSCIICCLYYNLYNQKVKEKLNCSCYFCLYFYVCSCQMSLIIIAVTFRYFTACTIK